MTKIKKKVSHLPLDVQGILSNLGKNIQISRKRRDMTQAQLAEAMFVSRQTLGRIENGDPSIAISTYLTAIYCLQREKEFDDFLRPENDKIGMLRDIQRQENRKSVRHSKQNFPDF